MVGTDGAVGPRTEDWALISHIFADCDLKHFGTEKLQMF